MLAEVAERGLALTGTRHLLLVGGVACECGGRGLVGGAWPGWEGVWPDWGQELHSRRGVWPVGKGRGHALGAWLGLEGAWSCDLGAWLWGRGVKWVGLIRKGRGQVFGVWSGVEGAWPVGKGAGLAPIGLGLPSMGRGLTPGGVA